MIKFTTGNILESNTNALVNTVNCEGYMGKGIAYQFKLKFPNNFKEYFNACKSGEFRIGEILTFCEENRVIINFPTKNEWRKKSEYSFITQGMNKLVQLLPVLNIDSISIPPLGCGNGGLEWNRVKHIITNTLQPIESDFEILIYEPSTNYTRNTIKEPTKINASHYILMRGKKEIKNFNKSRLQKTLYVMNFLSNDNYFKFYAHPNGPYSQSIDTLSQDIKEFQEYYRVNTHKALEIAKGTIISDSFMQKYEKYKPYLDQAVQIINTIETRKELEAFTTILFIIDNFSPVEKKDIPDRLLEWSEYKSQKITDNDIENSLQSLIEYRLIQKSLLGYEPVHTAM